MPCLTVGKFLPEVGAGGGASVEVFDAEVFVGAVQVVAVLAPAEKQRVTPRITLKLPTTEMEPPSRIITGTLPNDFSIAVFAAAM